MNTYDNLIIKLFYDKDKNSTNSNFKKFVQRIRFGKYKNILNYLNNRFSDSQSNSESVQRIIYKIEKRPTCPICGKEIKYVGKPNSKCVFKTYCSNSCANKANSTIANETKIRLYGSNNNIAKNKQTKLERYGNPNYNGDRKSAVLKTDYKTRDVKSKQTKLERYGNPNYNGDRKLAASKVNKTLMVHHCKETCLKRYGNPNYNGDRKLALSKIDKRRMVEHMKQTKLERYGDQKYNNVEKNKQTCLEKYGYGSWMSSDEGKKTMAQILASRNVRIKVNETKKKNKSFNSSKAEIEINNLLKEKYPDVIWQYTSELYPFNCDFYIPSKDLYIEFNGSWTHGPKPYENSEDDKILLEKWRSKNTDYYKNAITTWTIRDPRKRNVAKSNDLNYLEFWNINEVKDWLNNQP